MKRTRKRKRTARPLARIHLETAIRAAADVIFDLARDVDAHIASAPSTDERVIDGVRHGLMNAGDEVTWEASHLGRRRRMTVRVVALDRPREFEDHMVTGPFTRMSHRHVFEPHDDWTLMIDDFEYELPYGVLGALAGVVVVTPYLRRFLRERARHLKRLAEARSG